MADWHVDGNAADDSGDATSEGTAVKTLRGLTGKPIASLDVIRIKYNAVAYTITPANTLGMDLIVNSASGIVLTVLPYVGDTQKPKIVATKDTSNPTYATAFVGGSSRVFVQNIEVEDVYTGTTNTTSPFCWSQSNNGSARTDAWDCVKRDTKADNPTTNHNAYWGGATSTFNNCKIIQSGGRFNNTASYINCWGILGVGNNMISGGGLNTGNRFIAKIYANTSVLFGSSLDFFHSNTFLMEKNAGGGTYTNLAFVNLPNPATSFEMSCFNNLMVAYGGSADIYGYRGAVSGIDVIPGPSGKNCFSTLTALLDNVNSGNPEGFGVSSQASFNETLFLSLDPDNANFLKVDESVSGVDTYIRGQGVGGADIGALPLSVLSGETDPDKVLNTSTAITGNIDPDNLLDSDPSGAGELDSDEVTTAAGGNYVKPSEAIVKKDEEFGVDNVGTYDGSDRWSDPGVSHVRAGQEYKANSETNNRTGLLDLPAEADVKIAVKFDQETKTGSYTGSDRWSDPGEANVRDSVAYKANSPTNNKTGTIVVPASTDVRDGVAVDASTGSLVVPSEDDVRDGVEFDNDSEGNLVLPAEANVKTGTGGYGSAGTEFTPAYSPDFPARVNVAPDDTVDGEAGTMDLPALDRVSPNATLRGNTGTQDLPALSNVDENDTLEGVPGTLHVPYSDSIDPSELKSGVTKTINDAEVVGTDKGEDFNSEIPEDQVILGYEYTNLGEEKVGTAEAGDTDYPPEDKVLVGTVFGNGQKTGTFGSINESNLAMITEMIEDANALIQATLPDFTPLKYFKDVIKNDFYSEDKQFGIRAMVDSLTFEKQGGIDTLDVDFEIKLTQGFVNNDGDEDERTQELYLISKMEALRRAFRVTKFAACENVRIIRGFDRDEPEKIGDKVVLVRAVVTVNLNVNNHPGS